VPSPVKLADISACSIGASIGAIAIGSELATAPQAIKDVKRTISHAKKIDLRHIKTFLIK
jgi:hypothetical protein